MPWVISFIVAWIVFFILVDWHRLKVNITAGILSLLLGTIVDWGGQKLQLYTFHDLIIPWFGCSAFYKFGPIFTMGIIFAQSVPKKRGMQTFNILVLSLLYLSMEYLIINTHAAEYIHWHILASLIVDLLTLSAMTWFTLAFLKQEI